MANYLSVFISVFIDIYSFVIIATILMSWFPGGSFQLKSFLKDVTEPYLVVFRNIIPRIGMIDISPVVALISLDLIKYLLLTIISYLFA